MLLHRQLVNPATPDRIYVSRCAVDNGLVSLESLTGVTTYDAYTGRELYSIERKWPLILIARSPDLQAAVVQNGQNYIQRHNSLVAIGCCETLVLTPDDILFAANSQWVCVDCRSPNKPDSAAASVYCTNTGHCVKVLRYPSAMPPVSGSEYQGSPDSSVIAGWGEDDAHLVIHLWAVHTADCVPVCTLPTAVRKRQQPDLWIVRDAAIWGCYGVDGTWCTGIHLLTFATTATTTTTVPGVIVECVGTGSHIVMGKFRPGSIILSPSYRYTVADVRDPELRNQLSFTCDHEPRKTMVLQTSIAVLPLGDRLEVWDLPTQTRLAAWPYRSTKAAINTNETLVLGVKLDDKGQYWWATHILPTPLPVVMALALAARRHASTGLPP